MGSPRRVRPPAHAGRSGSAWLSSLREEEVLTTVARGRTNAEIAEELHMSLSTVRTHVGSLMRKIAARNRVEIAAWAYQTGRVAT